MHSSRLRQAPDVVGADATTTSSVPPAPQPQYYAVCDSIQRWYESGGATGETATTRSRVVTSCAEPLASPNYALASRAGRPPAPPPGRSTKPASVASRHSAQASTTTTATATDEQSLEKAYHAMLQRASQDVTKPTR